MIVGYCEPQSLGGELAAGKKGVYILGDSCDVRADVVVLPGLSAHGDYNDLEHFIACQDQKKVRQLFLVHGEYKVQEQFQQRLVMKQFKQVSIPEQHSEVEI